jgi:hypothetical protein
VVSAVLFLIKSSLIVKLSYKKKQWMPPRSLLILCIITGPFGRLAPMAAELVDRLAILVAIRRFIRGMGAVGSRSLRSYIYVRMQHFVRRSTSVPFRRFWGDVRHEFMQRLSAPLHGTLGSYLRGAFQEASADAVACLPVPRA